MLFAPQLFFATFASTTGKEKTMTKSQIQTDPKLSTEPKDQTESLGPAFKSAPFRLRDLCSTVIAVGLSFGLATNAQIGRLPLPPEVSTPVANAVTTPPIRNSTALIELNFVAEMFSQFYAPQDWKKSHVGWDLNAERAKAEQRILAAKNLHEQRSALVQFIGSTADYHVSIGFHATERASLPFSVKTVEGKTLIVFIDRNQLSTESFPFELGDELISMNRQPISQVRAELMAVEPANVASTDESLADLAVTSRRASRGFAVPNGTVTLGILRKGTNTPVTHQTQWVYTPESVHQGTRPARVVNASLTDAKKKLKLPMMTSPLAIELAANSKAENPFGIGMRKSFVTDFGNRIWETESSNTFDAYIFQNASGKLVGVVRIPSYYFDGKDAAETLKLELKAASDFAGIIKHFEANTSSLIIDQLNNPGGSVFYLYNLASMLTTDSLFTPRHRVTLSADLTNSCQTLLNQTASIRSEQEASESLGEDFGSFPVSLTLVRMARSYCTFVIAEYQSGKRLSAPTYIWGADRVNPSRVANYTKPIVVLVNELDFSGGDFFPTILQDNKRAKIVGTRTSGAGGYVESIQFPSGLGISQIGMTGSIAERIDGNPIENLGVTPDVIVPFTLKDVQSGSYSEYREAVLKQVVTD